MVEEREVLNFQERGVGYDNEKKHKNHDNCRNGIKFTEPCL